MAKVKRIGDLCYREFSEMLNLVPKLSIPQVAVLDQHRVVQVDPIVQAS